MRSLWALLFMLFIATALDSCVHAREDGGDDSDRLGQKIEPEVESDELLLETGMKASVGHLFKKAQAALQANQLVMAHSFAERAFALEPNDARVIFLMARIAFNDAQFEDAEQWALRAFENLDEKSAGNRKLVSRFIIECRDRQGKSRDGIQEVLDAVEGGSH